MTQCECPLAGYCQRHKTAKGSGWHKLCQTKENYFQAWEDGRGPGQKPKTNDERTERRERVQLAVKKKQRLISWLQFFRHPKDRGIGDTAFRLVHQKKKSPIYIASDAHKAVDCLLKQCSCSRSNAVAKLNQQYPY